MSNKQEDKAGLTNLASALAKIDLLYQLGIPQPFPVAPGGQPYLEGVDLEDLRRVVVMSICAIDEIEFGLGEMKYLLGIVKSIALKQALYINDLQARVEALEELLKDLRDHDTTIVDDNSNPR